MLNFNKKGLLTPNRNITSSLEELKQYFVDQIQSNTRADNFEKYSKYSEELKKILGVTKLKQWINGSFVTKKNNPKDIDLVTFVDFDLRIKFQKELKQFEAPNANNIYGVDAYLVTVIPDNHKDIYLYQCDKAYWLEKFSKTRRDSSGIKNDKGFLEIFF